MVRAAVTPYRVFSEPVAAKAGAAATTAEARAM